MAGLVLCTNGSFIPVAVPPTAQELASHWSSPQFPRGVVLHSMMHLSASIVQQLFGRVDATVSLSLLRDSRTPRKGDCNYHEIPRALDTQLFFGDIMMVLTANGTTILPLTATQYKLILDADVNVVLTTLPAYMRSTRRSYSSSEPSPVQRPQYTARFDEEEEDEAMEFYYQGDEDDDSEMMDISPMRVALAT